MKTSYVKLRASLPFASAERGTHPVHVSGWELAPAEPVRGAPLSQGRSTVEHCKRYAQSVLTLTCDIAMTVPRIVGVCVIITAVVLQAQVVSY